MPGEKAEAEIFRCTLASIGIETEANEGGGGTRGEEEDDDDIWFANKSFLEEVKQRNRWTSCLCLVEVHVLVCSTHGQYREKNIFDTFSIKSHSRSHFVVLFHRPRRKKTLRMHLADYTPAKEARRGRGGRVLSYKS